MTNIEWTDVTWDPVTGWGERLKVPVFLGAP